MKKQLTFALVAGLFITGNAFALSADKALSDTRSDPIKDRWGDCILTHDGLNTCGKAAPAPAMVTTKLTLGADAFFDFNKDTLKSAGKASLDKLQADLQKVHKIQEIKLEGHTDSVGSDKYNQKLSERRAKTVANYLVSKGVPSNIVSIAAFGETKPVATNATAAGRAQNRRVDVTVVADEAMKK